jgi:hypothetical protein
MHGSEFPMFCVATIFAFKEMRVTVCFVEVTKVEVKDGWGLVHGRLYVNTGLISGQEPTLRSCWIVEK